MCNRAHHKAYDANRVGQAMKRILLIGLLVATGLSGCLNDDDMGPLVVDPDTYPYPGPATIPELDANALLVHLKSFVDQFGERAANLPAHTGARDAIAAHFENAGLDVWRQNFTNGIYQENIVGVLWGYNTDQWVVVGGHYDMTTTDCIVGGVANAVLDQAGAPVNAPDCVTRPFSQGAYDDGSGTLMTMHLATAFADMVAKNGTLPYTIAFVGFDGEERGLQGSGAFAANVFAEENGGIEDLAQETPWGNVTVHAMLDLDMFGLNYPAITAPIYFDNNNAALVDYVKARAAEINFPADQIKYQGISLGRSDYAHFMNAGVPTGFFISDFEEWELPANIPVVVPCEDAMPTCTAYPFWHIEDTWDTMVLMAGSESELEAGFDMANKLASGVLFFMATTHDLGPVA